MIKNKKNIRVVVAMSGGVDSSVAAALLKKAGFDVIGIMMKFWHAPRSLGEVGKEDNRCCSVESEKLARLVAKEIGIPFYVVNVEKEFKKKVVDYFLQEYKKGNTPNPCVVCNKEIKFGFLIKKALSLGADFVATGHYAQNSFGSNSSLAFVRQRGLTQASAFSRLAGPCKMPAGYASNLLPHSSIFRLFSGKDVEKDQSYFLWQLDQKQISRVLFPVGGYTKLEVRKLAKKFNLPTAKTPESQEVCFIPASLAGRQNTTNEFLKKYLKSKPGKIINIVGKVVGSHQGLWFYTIGQRKGIEVQQGPWYVVGKNLKNNTLIISKNQKDLFRKEAKLTYVNLINSQKFPGLKGYPVEVRIRYKSKLAKARIVHLNNGRVFSDRKKHGNGDNERVKIIFDKPQRAITPGQSAVFYRGKELLGGGVIE